MSETATITAKSFNQIARILEQNGANDVLINDFADWLESTNERFNRARFVQAAKGA